MESLDSLVRCVSQRNLGETLQVNEPDGKKIKVSTQILSHLIIDALFVGFYNGQQDN